MKISPVGRDDVQAVAALVAELLLELGAEGREFAGIDRTKLEHDLDRSLTAGRFLALLARDDSGEALGVLTLSEGCAIYAGGCYGVIDEMYVKPTHRAQGVGRSLLAAAQSLALERGWTRLDVTAPEEDAGGGAARFYEEHGFRFTGRKLRLLLDPEAPF